MFTFSRVAGSGGRAEVAVCFSRRSFRVAVVLRVLASELAIVSVIYLSLSLSVSLAIRL